MQVSVYLANGIQLVGRLEAFDQYVMLLKSPAGTQMIYKHAISTVVPSRPVNYRFDESTGTVETVVKKRTQFGLKRTAYSDSSSSREEQPSADREEQPAAESQPFSENEQPVSEIKEPVVVTRKPRKKLESVDGR